MACTIHNSKKFHKGGRVVRWAPRFLPPTSGYDSLDSK
jgi:hypothetical protein